MPEQGAMSQSLNVSDMAGSHCQELGQAERES